MKNDEKDLIKTGIIKPINDFFDHSTTDLAENIAGLVLLHSDESIEANTKIARCMLVISINSLKAKLRKTLKDLGVIDENEPAKFYKLYEDTDEKNP